jgi:hypothetical protein
MKTKKVLKDEVGFSQVKLVIPDFEAHLEGKFLPEIVVKIYPNDELKPMVKLVGHIGPLHRPVYEDPEGVLWVRDIDDKDPTYYPVWGEKIDFLGESGG